MFFFFKSFFCWPREVSNICWVNSNHVLAYFSIPFCFPSLFLALSFIGSSWGMEMVHLREVRRSPFKAKRAWTMISLSHYDNFMFSTVKTDILSNFDRTLCSNGWIFFPPPGKKVALDRNGLVQEMMKEQERYGAMEDARMRFCLFLWIPKFATLPFGMIFRSRRAGSKLGGHPWMMLNSYTTKESLEDLGCNGRSNMIWCRISWGPSTRGDPPSHWLEAAIRSCPYTSIPKL